MNARYKTMHVEELGARILLDATTLPVMLGDPAMIATLSPGAAVDHDQNGADHANEHNHVPQGQETASHIEIVFCLDTTGSMTGLIEGAKQKIWSICNWIASAAPTAELKIGLVAYRDRGDSYVTSIVNLTDNLDDVSRQLNSFQAGGGGDGPESVNQALADAVHGIRWSRAADTLRIIFLVGDAPPHMDYADDVKYPTTCAEAVHLGITINTIQCGNWIETTPVWQDISAKTGGSFVQIAQNGGMTSRPTPYDAELAAINAELAAKGLYYGDKTERDAARVTASASLSMSVMLQADRVAFVAKTGSLSSDDLLDAVNAKRIKLENLKKEELPDELKGLSLQEQRDYLGKLDEERTTLRQKALELDKKRLDYLASRTVASSFDFKVLDMLRSEAGDAGIAFSLPPLGDAEDDGADPGPIGDPAPELIGRPGLVHIDIGTVWRGDPFTGIDVVGETAEDPPLGKPAGARSIDKEIVGASRAEDKAVDVRGVSIPAARNEAAPAFILPSMVAMPVAPVQTHIEASTGPDLQNAIAPAVQVRLQTLFPNHAVVHEPQETPLNLRLDEDEGGDRPAAETAREVPDRALVARSHDDVRLLPASEFTGRTAANRLNQGANKAEAHLLLNDAGTDALWVAAAAILSGFYVDPIPSNPREQRRPRSRVTS